ncbi:MAG: uroporphyrinogen decarboxylase family protein, partial [Halanaerobiales bacterium]
IEVVNDSPIDIINFGDNIHAGTLSPGLFKKYVLPAYQKRNHQLHKADKFTSAHWDGDTKELLPYARETGLDGIEAITPKPQGDVTLEEVKQALGDMFLLDGIAAVLFNETYEEKRLIEQSKKIIELFAPNLILGISDEISSQGVIDRIKTVGKIVDDYNEKVEMNLT